MRKRLLFVLSFAIFATFVLTSGPVFGQAPNPVSDGKLRSDSFDPNLTEIILDCKAVQGKLRKVHEVDGLTRVNAGQKYESIANKLMAPMNTYLVKEGYDASKMVEVAAKYNKQIEEFKNSYMSYEGELSSFLRKDCSRNEHNLFYQELLRIRQHRVEIYDINQKIQESIYAYRAEFDKFTRDFKVNKGITESQAQSEVATGDKHEN